MGTFLDQFLDAGVTPEPGAWNGADEITAQVERLLNECVIVLHAKNMKRRLGQEASPAELSADKKIGKMVYNRLLTCFQVWGGEEEEILERYAEAIAFADPDTHDDKDLHELIVQGAQLDWDAFWTKKKDYLKLHVRFVANNAVANNVRPLGNKYANRFVNEYNSIGDVLDPVDTQRENKFDAI